MNKNRPRVIVRRETSKVGKPYEVGEWVEIDSINQGKCTCEVEAIRDGYVEFREVGRRFRQEKVVEAPLC